MENLFLLPAFGFGMFVIFGFVLALGSFVIWVVALVHALVNKNLDDGEKIIWSLIIFLTQILGAILYYISVIHNKKYDTFSTLLKNSSKKSQDK